MDPAAAIEELRGHVARGEVEEAFAGLEDLREWVGRGGAVSRAGLEQLLEVVGVLLEDVAGRQPRPGEDDPDSECVACGAGHAPVRTAEAWGAMETEDRAALVGDGPGIDFPAPVCGECWCPK